MCELQLILKDVYSVFDMATQSRYDTYRNRLHLQRTSPVFSLCKSLWGNTRVHPHPQQALEVEGEREDLGVMLEEGRGGLTTTSHTHTHTHTHVQADQSRDLAKVSIDWGEAHKTDINHALDNFFGICVSKERDFAESDGTSDLETCTDSDAEYAGDRLIDQYAGHHVRQGFSILSKRVDVCDADCRLYICGAPSR